MFVSSRRSLLAGFASVGALGLAACSGVREIPAEGQSPSPSGGATAAAGDAGTLRIRTRDRLEVDLSAILSAFDDTGNVITVAVTGTRGVIKAKVWLMRDLLAGDTPFGFVKRELLDYFVVEVIGGVTGKSPGTITFTGYTGPNSSGSQVTQTLSLTCDDTPPTTWAMGANTLAGFGGLPVHQYFPGNPQDWVLLNLGQFALLKDPKPRTELGSGRSYPNGYCRLVLAGPLYGGPPLIPVVAGKSAMVVLYNKSLGQTRMLTVNFVGGQTDVAPWPAVDTLGSRDAPTTQLGVAMRNPKNFAFGSTFMLEEGDHLNNTLQIGFTTDFGTTRIAGVAPGGCFIGDSKLYTPNPVYHDRLVTWRGRTPSVYADKLIFDLRSISRSINATAGFRFTRMTVGELRLFDGASQGSWDIICMDHLTCTVLGPTPGSGTVDFTAGMNPCVISNWIKGQINFSGNDAQFIGNRIETPAVTMNAPGDSSDFTGRTFNSDDNNPVSTVAFNLWINKQGPDSPLHVDYLQGNSTSASASGQTRRAMRFYGNVVHAGKRRISTGTAPGRAGDLGKNLPGGGECIFMFDWGSNSPNWQWEIAGNLIVESVYWGLGFLNPAAGTKIRHNMLLDDLANTNPVSDHDKPTIDLQASGGWTTAENAGISIENNIQSQNFISQRNSINAGAYHNNLLGVQSSWQIANLVNPAIGGAARDIADIEAAFSFKAGAPIAQGPFHNKALLDMRRHTADLDTLLG